MSTEAFVSPDALARVLDADRSSNGALLQSIVDSELMLRQLRAWQLGCVRELVEHTQPVQRSPRSTRNSKRPTPEDETLTDAFGPNTASQIRSGSLVSAQLAPELTLSRNSAWSLARTSVELPRDLPMIAALFETGRLDWDRARLINDRLHRPPHKPEWFGPVCPQWLLFQVALAEQAPSLPYHALQVLIDQLLLGLAPDGANERHAQARRARSVWTELLPDGMTAVHAILAADDGQLLDGVLDAMADACRDRLLAEGRTDPRTHEQRRADALTAIVQALAEGLDIPLAHDTRREQADDETDRRADDGEPEPEPTDEKGNGSSTGPDAHDMTGAPGPSRAAEPSRPPKASEPSEPFRAPRPTESSGAPKTPESSGASKTSESSGAPEPRRTSELPDSSGTSEPSGDAARNTHARDAGRTAAAVTRPARPSDERVEPAACPTCRHRAHENLDEAADQARSDSFGGFGFSALPLGRIPAWWELPSLPRKKGHGPHLVITITDATLLGLDNVPGLLQGYGAVPADLARRIAVSARDITLLPVPGAAAGSNGQPDSSAGPAPGCSYGRDHSTPQAHRYHPGRVLTDQVNARYQTCTFPGCGVPSNRCDLDHLVPFDEGGTTCPCKQVPC
ncbi:DUF222 domain-containing protein [Kineosporia mesophila]|nr:DUF222 domain-containing protein [Kineosporia mesophila]MCD5349118.1 DUF222 domain-containing protein [Kineosporia mesophila]